LQTQKKKPAQNTYQVRRMGCVVVGWVERALFIEFLLILRDVEIRKKFFG